MPHLAGNDIDKLTTLLVRTLSFDDLERFVHASTGDQLYDFYVAKDQPKSPMVRKLLLALEELGTTADFLAYVYAERPGRDDVRRAISELFPEAIEIPTRKIDLSVQSRGTAISGAPNNALTPGLQRNVRPYLPKPDVRVWQEKLLRIERQVCRIEVEARALGTGFLVGPASVLTNWHVFEAAKMAGKIDKLGCRFDYLRLPDDSVQVGQLVPVDLGSPIDASPYSAAELTARPTDRLPTAGELDYALLHLSSRIGDEAARGTNRGWISLPNESVPVAPDDPALIVQHPQGEPMKLALDTQAIIGPNSNGTRLLYRTNTEPGSSGSPVFTMNWDIVALHHYGDPKWANPIFNQGIPIGLIRRRIETSGFGNALGG